MEFFLKRTKIDDHAPQHAAFSGHQCKKKSQVEPITLCNRNPQIDPVTA